MASQKKSPQKEMIRVLGSGLATLHRILPEKSREKALSFYLLRGVVSLMYDMAGKGEVTSEKVNSLREKITEIQQEAGVCLPDTSYFVVR